MKPSNPSVRRLRILLVGLLLWSGAIVGRLVSLQVFQHDKLAAKAVQQQQKSTRVMAKRGTIYDRSSGPLAQTLESDSVVADPQVMPDLPAAASMLAKTLNLNAAELLRRLQVARGKGLHLVYVARKLTPLESERVRALKLVGIEFEEGMRRYYPRGELAAHVLGAMGHLDPPKQDAKTNASFQNVGLKADGTIDEDAELGTAGIERLFEKDLAGRAGKTRIYRDSKQKVYHSEITEEPLDGENITLTIDPNIQYQAELELREAVKVSGAKGGTVVALDPYTGDVLAMASYPTYNPNFPLGKGKTAQDARSNLAIATKFEPGSVFKVITLAAALEKTNLRPDSTINCGNGIINLNGRVIHDHKRYSTLTMAEVLAHSSNIGAIRIALETKPEPLYEVQKNFGFGAKTGIELPAEASGILWPASQWRASSIGSIAMGHEVTVTSLQLAVAGAVIANGGLHVKPRIVLARQRPGQPVEKTPAPKAERILRPETAIQMRQMMEGVVLTGTGRRAILKGYTSGGKTGSAQIYDPKTKKYTHDYNASFLGFAPVTNPRIVISVSLFGTTGGETGYGGVRAAPVFKEVAMGALRIMDVPKDLPGSVDSAPVSDAFDEEDDLPMMTAPGKGPTSLISGLDPTPLSDIGGKTVAHKGDAGVHSSSVRGVESTRNKAVSSVTPPLAKGNNPVSGSASGQRPFLRDAASAQSSGSAPSPAPSKDAAAVQPHAATAGGHVVPDFRGMTLRAVLQRSAAAGMNVQVNGSGMAVNQEPPPGSVLLSGSAVRVQFER